MDTIVYIWLSIHLFDNSLNYEKLELFCYKRKNNK